MRQGTIPVFVTDISLHNRCVIGIMGTSTLTVFFAKVMK